MSNLPHLVFLRGGGKMHRLCDMTFTSLKHTRVVAGRLMLSPLINANDDVDDGDRS